MRRSFRSSGGRTLLRAVMVASLAAAVACSDEETSAAASESATASATASATTDTSVTGMNRPVMVSVTGNADNDFLRMIGDHHRGLLVSTGPTKDKFGANNDVRADAARLDTKATADLDIVTKLLRAAFNDSYQPKVLLQDQTLAGSLSMQKGVDFDRQFYQQTIKHFEQGVAMIDQTLPKLTRPEIKAMAQRMRDDASSELAVLKGKRDAIK